MRVAHGPLACLVRVGRQLDQGPKNGDVWVMATRVLDRSSRNVGQACCPRDGAWSRGIITQETFLNISVTKMSARRCFEREKQRFGGVVEVTDGRAARRISQLR